MVLPKEIALHYNTDGLQLADEEYAYPFIEKVDKLNTYSYPEPGLHSGYYTIYFKTNKLNAVKYFDGTNFRAEIPIPNLPIKNVNYLHNSKTFTLRTFLKFKQLIKEHEESFIFNGVL